VYIDLENVSRKHLEVLSKYRPARGFSFVGVYSDPNQSMGWTGELRKVPPAKNSADLEILRQVWVTGGHAMIISRDGIFSTAQIIDAKINVAREPEDISSILSHYVTADSPMSHALRMILSECYVNGVWECDCEGSFASFESIIEHVRRSSENPAHPVNSGMLLIASLVEKGWHRDLTEEGIEPHPGPGPWQHIVRMWRDSDHSVVIVYDGKFTPGTKSFWCGFCDQFNSMRLRQLHLHLTQCLAAHEWDMDSRSIDLDERRGDVPHDLHSKPLLRTTLRHYRQATQILWYHTIDPVNLDDYDYDPI
jgi:hypothetical protein